MSFIQNYQRFTAYLHAKHHHKENNLTMSDSITISPLTETDIPGAISAIQEAFAEDPYNLWVYNDRTKAS
jgi:hypothetical protein